MSFKMSIFINQYLKMLLYFQLKTVARQYNHTISININT